MNTFVKGISVALLLVLSAAAGFFAYKSTQYDFKTLDNSTYRWADLDDSWVIVNYFAPWCAPCLREMPELNALNQQLPANTHLFAINYDVQTLEQMQEMKTRFSIELPLIVSEPNTQLPMEKPPYLPATFIIGPSGKVVDTVLGEVSADMLKERIAILKNAS